MSERELQKALFPADPEPQPRASARALPPSGCPGRCLSSGCVLLPLSATSWLRFPTDHYHSGSVRIGVTATLRPPPQPLRPSHASHSFLSDRLSGCPFLLDQVSASESPLLFGDGCRGWGRICDKPSIVFLSDGNPAHVNSDLRCSFGRLRLRRRLRPRRGEKNCEQQNSQPGRSHANSPRS
jgi:hypothetical protein